MTLTGGEGERKGEGGREGEGERERECNATRSADRFSASFARWRRRMGRGEEDAFIESVYSEKGDDRTMAEKCTAGRDARRRRLRQSIPIRELPDMMAANFLDSSTPYALVCIWN